MPVAMNVNRSQRNQGLAGSAFGDDHGGPRPLPAFHNAHEGNRLRWKRPSQKSVNSRGDRGVERMQSWVFLKDPFSQHGGVGAHVVVDGGKLGHGNPQTLQEESRKVNAGKTGRIPVQFSAGRRSRFNSKFGQWI